MSNRPENSSFWRTAPGILTAFAGAVTAIAGLVAVLSDAGVLGPDPRLAPDPGLVSASETFSDARGEGAADSSRPVVDVSGRWTATVAYPWGVTVEETFDLLVEDGRVAGTASYFGIPRALVEPEIAGSRISFRTRVEEVLGDETSWYENSYDGLITPRGIDFRLFDSHGRGPIEFTMRRQ